MTEHLTSTFPIDGELINHARALECGPDFFRIEVRGKTLPGRTVRINGVPAHSEEDASFRGEAELRGRFPELLLEDGTETLRIRPVCDYDRGKRYNFFIDDNSFFLTEIVRKRHHSIFDSFYLDFLRRMHLRYGMKVTLNTFFRNDHEPFLLTEMSDSYRSEWEDNSSWLRLAPHAYSEFPGNPYCEAFPEKLPEHFRAVTEQIRRFAGEKTVVAPVIMHFYRVTNEESMRFLRKEGMKVFTVHERFWKQLRETYGREFFGVYDFRHDQLQIPVEFFCNLLSTEQILRHLESCYAIPGKDFINFGSHEQYSYPFYSNYIPEHFERIEAALKSLSEHGYEADYFNLREP